MTKHAIAITAHYDDAVLWCGGAIVRTLSLGWRWTVVAMCTPAPDRQQYFDNYCESLGVKAVRFDMADYQSGDLFSENDRDTMESRIQNLLAEDQADLIFTHSKDAGGEYGGHTNHDEVRDSTLSVVNGHPVVHFAYNPEFGYNGCGTTARIDADFHLQLTYDELIEKAKWCRNVPDADSSLKALGYPCPNPEGFRSDHQLGWPFIPK